MLARTIGSFIYYFYLAQKNRGKQVVIDITPELIAKIETIGRGVIILVLLFILYLIT